MLFVSNPEPFRKLLPGFLPVVGGYPGSTDLPSDLVAILRTLDMAGGKSLGVSAAQPRLVPQSPFWTDWFLADAADASQYDQLRDAMSTPGSASGRLVCLALSGRGFHGQGHRAWEAARGNLHLSLGLRCNLDAAVSGLALPMLPAVAVVDALIGLTEGRPRAPAPGIKWVNDILVGERKIGGVLTSAKSQEGRIRTVVWGIGLNVGTLPDVIPTPFTPAVTCLDEHIPFTENNLKNALGAVLSAVAARFDELASRGPQRLLEAYRDYSLILGREVEVHPEDTGSAPVRRGRALAINPDLSLVLSDSPVPVTGGRLVLCNHPD